MGYENRIDAKTKLVLMIGTDKYLVKAEDICMRTAREICVLGKQGPWCVLEIEPVKDDGDAELQEKKSSVGERKE